MDRETWHDGWWILTDISAKGAKFLMKNSTWNCVAAELSYLACSNVAVPREGS